MLFYFAPPDTDFSGVFVAPDIQVVGESSAPVTADHLPVTELGGKSLEKRKRATLGETLAHEAGVASSFFGPGASRPVVRGQDGDRVRVLQNGIGSIDASGASADHAVAVDPMVVDRVEVLRGPAALLYGNSAIGGVINTINGRIPEPWSVAPGLNWRSGYSSVDRGVSAGVVMNLTAGAFAAHLDGVVRGTHDYGIPIAPYRVLNSASETQDGAIGLSWFPKSTQVLGAAFSAFHTVYGTVAEPAVTIRLQRQRVDLAFGQNWETGWLRSVRGKTALSFYQHQELDAEVVGTTFRNVGNESRLEWNHRSIGPFEGTIGFQEQVFQFDARGTEAFLPSTLNTAIAGFLSESARFGDWTPSAALRYEAAATASSSDPKFGPSLHRAFSVPSAAVGLAYRFNDMYTLGLNTTFSQRAPNAQELFANGSHLATGTFERGDRSLGPEQSLGAELTLKITGRINGGRIGAFLQDYSAYIAMLPAGAHDPTFDLPIFQAALIRSRLFGAEFEYHDRLPWQIGTGHFEWEARFDWVRALDLTRATNLPRITPIRETLGLEYVTPAGWSTDIEVQRAEAQSLTAPGELVTPAYMMVNLGAELPVHLGGATPLRLSAHLNNFFDVEARNHVSFLKDRAPLPGRSVVVALSGAF